MKKYLTLLILPVLCLSLGAGRAAAGDEAWAALGGFVGGVITTKVFDHHRDYHRGHRTEVIVVERDRPGKHHGHYTHGHSKHGCDNRCDRYERPVRYKTVRTREWVPGFWEVRYDRCGTRIRTWQPGYYKQATKRVRVDIDRDYDDHGYAYRDYSRRR